MGKTCFVVMGFGEKTDFQSSPQRVLDLDKTYRVIIRPAVEAAGLECIRADQIDHSGVIDKPMYEWLLKADVVVADLSTSNANALYELGVRHALRPHTTIIMAESNFRFPFDVKALNILQYEHLGKGIDAEEAGTKSKVLEARIRALVDAQQTDSPVYTFLNDLQPPKTSETSGAPAPEALAAASDDKSSADLLQEFRAARRDSDFGGAKALLKQLRKLRPHDPYILQQLAVATYKAKRPDALAALVEAKTLLEPLHPSTSSDAETVGIWGAIHKRLWECTGNRSDMDEALRAYERAFRFTDSYYGGINYAFLLDFRASLSSGDDAIADRVFARRVRLEVLDICDRELANPAELPDAAERFWVEAARAEAVYGLGRVAEAEALRGRLSAEAPERWMWLSLEEQLAKLERLLQLTTAASPGS